MENCELQVPSFREFDSELDNPMKKKKPWSKSMEVQGFQFENSPKNLIMCRNEVVGNSEISEIIKVTPNSSLQWWLTYFKMGFCLCYTPFLIKQEPNGGKLISYKNKLNMILYFCLQCVALAVEFNSCFLESDLKSLQFIQVFIKVMGDVGGVLSEICFFYVFWTQSEGVVRVMNIIANGSSRKKPTVAKFLYSELQLSKVSFKALRAKLIPSSRTKAILLCVLFLCIASYLVSEMLTNYWTSEFYSVLQWRRKTANRFLKIFTKNVCDDSDPHSNFTVTWFEYTFHAVNSVIKVYCSWIYIINDLFVILTVLFYGQLVNIFLKDYVEPNNNFSAEEVLHGFAWFREVIRKINASVGKAIFAVLLMNLALYIRIIPQIIMSPSYGIQELRNMFEFSYFFLMLFYGAKQYHKLEASMKSWISQPHIYKQVEEKKLSILMFTLNSGEDMALSIIGNMGINQAFCTSVLGAIFTYTIIVLQFQSVPQ